MGSSDDDPEVRTVVALVSQASMPTFLDHIEKFSSIAKVIRIAALCLKFVRVCLKRIDRSASLTAKDLAEAELQLVGHVQRNAFADELKLLQSNQQVSGKHVLSKLGLFVDTDGLIRVGGRIRLAKVSYDFKHPCLLPKGGHFTQLIIDRAHSRVKHSGRGMTLNEVRSSGFWIVAGSRAVSSFITRCVTCRRLRFSASI